MSDRFIEGLIDGKKEVVEEIYQRYLDSTIRWTTNNNGSRSDALDVFQEALTQILIAARKNKINLRTNFGAYLISTCKYIWLGRIKKENKLEVVRFDQKDILSIEIEEEMTNHQRDKWLSTFLESNKQKLSGICIQLLTLIAQNANPSSIATQLNMTNANTVYRRKFACLKSWRAHIESDPLYHQWKDAQYGH